VIKELNQKLKKSEQERDSVKDANSEPKKHLEKEQRFYCDVCLFSSTSENEVRMHMLNRDHKRK
jgi:hypothetical protein